MNSPQKALAKIEQTIQMLHNKARVMQQFQVGKFYHVEYIERRWVSSSGNYQEIPTHMLGVFKGVNYFEAVIRVCASFSALTFLLAPRQPSKSGEYTRSFSLPAQYILGTPLTPDYRYGAEFTSIHEVATDDLLLYTNDAYHTERYKAYLSGTKVPGRRKTT